MGEGPYDARRGRGRKGKVREGRTRWRNRAGLLTLAIWKKNRWLTGSRGDP